MTGDASPLVRGAAVWALSRLATPEEVARLATTRQLAETDAAVLAEWNAAREAAGMELQ